MTMRDQRCASGCARSRISHSKTVADTCSEFADSRPRSRRLAGRSATPPAPVRSKPQQPLVELSAVEEDPASRAFLVKGNLAPGNELADPLRTAREVLGRPLDTIQGETAAACSRATSSAAIRSTS